MATITVKVPNAGGVQLNTNNGEHVHYFLTALGAVPIFNHACEHRALRRETDFPGHPKMNYEWVLPNSPGDLDAPDDIHGVIMSFFTATKYTLRIEHHNQSHNVIDVLSDKDYESTDPTDHESEGIRVFVI